MEDFGESQMLIRNRNNHKFNVVYRGLITMFIIIVASGILFSIIQYSTSTTSETVDKTSNILSDKNSSYIKVFDNNNETNITFHELMEKAHLKKISTKVLTTFEQQDDGCSCEGLGCGCCQTLKVPVIHLNDTGCVNFALNPKEIGISVLFTVNRYAIINETISPQDLLCVSPPYLGNLLHFCIYFYDLDVSNKNFHGCVQIKMKIFKILRLKEFNLGCFNLKVPFLLQQKLLESLAVASASNATTSFSIAKPTKDLEAFGHMLLSRK